MCTIIEEEWRDIKGYEDLYQVSNLGRVKSLGNDKSRKERILKPGNTNGYLKVVLSKNGKHSQYQIHRLVALAFIHNLNNLPQVNHKDENKENNRVDNLEWCYQKYNLNYGTRNERCSKRVICVETGIVYSSIKEASSRIGAHSSGIISCCKGRCKTYKGFHWRYAD